MEKIKNLQDLINEKAEYRLNIEIGKIAETIRNNDLLKTTNNPGLPDVLIEGGKNPYKKPYWFFAAESEFFEKVKAYWLPIYIKEETENFIKKVDELDSQIQDLKNTQYVDDY